MYHTKSVDEVFNLFKTTKEGLSPKEAQIRLETNGFNALKEKKKTPLIVIFLSQLKDPLIYILFFAGIVSLVLGIIEKSSEWIDSIIIFSVIIINATIGTFQEVKANSALEALKKMSSPLSIVKRNNEFITLPSRDLVLGDIVLIEEGTIVPADLRLIESSNLKIDESSLTGESQASLKNASIILNEKVSINDQSNMAFMSTICTYGRGEGVVVKTGMNTVIGGIATSLLDEKESLSPLQLKLNKLSKVLGMATIIIVLIMLIISLFRIDYSTDFVSKITENFLLAISLAVAAVPEGLTSVVTIVLSLGVEKMAKEHAIVKKLPTVETLGSTNVICSDKTGTLTQNKMTVIQMYVNDTLKNIEEFSFDEVKFCLEGLILSSNASIDKGTFGDPTEIALLEAGKKFEIYKTKLEMSHPRINEIPFDSIRKMMSSQNVYDKDKYVFTKGAVDSILQRVKYILIDNKVRLITSEDIAQIEKANLSMSNKALRNLALAYKKDDNLDENNLIFVGMVGMFDPPRIESKDAIKSLKEANIRTVMITGDHLDTAYVIGKELGIVERKEECLNGNKIDELSPEELKEKVLTTSIFARVSPSNKVQIVKALKENNLVVGMTGDGVNDAPSLKAADIGIAMGITGTDVAKEAANMILTDDNFSTIKKAVEEGRKIYLNIKKAIIFLLSSNLAEVLTLFLATSLFGLPTPLSPIHLLFINLITDTLPALSLGMDKGGEEEVMKEKPRSKDESIFARGSGRRLIVYGVLLSLISLAGFLLIPCMEGGCFIFNFSQINEYFALNPQKLMESQTLAFSILAVSELFYMFTITNFKKSVIHVFKDKNILLYSSFFIGITLQVLITEVPLFNSIFHTSSLQLQQWGLIIAFALIPIFIHELTLLVKKVINNIKRRKQN